MWKGVLTKVFNDLDLSPEFIEFCKYLIANLEHRAPSVILQFLVNKDVVDECVYISSECGRPLAREVSSLKEVDYLIDEGHDLEKMFAGLEFLNNTSKYLDAYMQQKPEYLRFRANLRSLDCGVAPQVRLVVSNRAFFNQELVKVFPNYANADAAQEAEGILKIIMIILAYVRI